MLAAPVVQAPDPWRPVFEPCVAVGGLLGIGFASHPETGHDLVMVVSRDTSLGSTVAACTAQPPTAGPWRSSAPPGRTTACFFPPMADCPTAARTARDGGTSSTRATRSCEPSASPLRGRPWPSQRAVTSPCGRAAPDSSTLWDAVPGEAGGQLSVGKRAGPESSRAAGTLQYALKLWTGLAPTTAVQGRSARRRTKHMVRCGSCPLGHGSLRHPHRKPDRPGGRACDRDDRAVDPYAPVRRKARTGLSNWALQRETASTS
jgi:hypothetical protein